DYYFFFQAEDGIRGFHVTGVQTCALPISVSRRNFLKSSATAAAGFMILPRHTLGGSEFLAPSDRINLGYIGTGKQAQGLLHNIRSEERRGGKARRIGGPAHESHARTECAE